MAVDTYRLGYGGHADIAGVQVLVTSASLTRAYSRPTTTMMDNHNNTGDEISEVVVYDGTQEVTGSVAFDVTDNALTLFTENRFFRRGYEFGVVVGDGEKSGSLDDCVLTGLSLSGSPGGLISAAVDFISRRDYNLFSGSSGSFIRDQEPYGYWYSGNVDVSEWSFSLTQNVSPVYTNIDSMLPTYLRVNNWLGTLSTTTYDNPQSHSEISIVTKVFQLSGATTSSAYNFGGQTELGTYNHEFSGLIDAHGSGFASRGSQATTINII